MSRRSRRQMSTGAGFPRAAAHVDLVNQVWASDPWPDLPGASPVEQEAFTAGCAAVAGVNLADRVDHVEAYVSSWLGYWDAGRIVATLVALTRRHPQVRTGARLFELAWPVLAEAHRQDMIVARCSVDQLRRIVDAAATAVTDTLAADTSAAVPGGR